jgi:capsular exopolysaccharide synthesis family protein
VTLRDYVRLLRENALIVIVCLLIGLLGSALVTTLMPREYRANVMLYVSAQIVPGADASAVYQGGELASQRMKSYEQLAVSTRVTEETIQRLQLDMTPDELAGRITAVAPLDTVVLDVTVTDESPDRAALIANTVADSFVRLVGQLEASAAGPQPALVTARVVRAANPPATSSAPNPPLNIALGGLLGLLVGVGAAALRHALDQSVRSSEMLRRMVGAPTLGVITRSPRMVKRPLVVRESPRAPQAEEFRQLRTTLQFNNILRHNKVFVIASALPEEGRTVTACNLAIALADAGSRALLIDADLRDPMAGTYLGIRRAEGLTSVLTGKTRLQNAARSWGDHPFDFLPSGEVPANPSELLGSRPMQELLAEARGRYDVVLVDTSPLLPFTDAAAVAPYTDGAILVVRHGRTRREQVRAAVSALEAVSAPLLGSVITMAPGKRRHQEPDAAGLTEQLPRSLLPYAGDGEPKTPGPWRPSPWPRGSAIDRRPNPRASTP